MPHSSGAIKKPDTHQGSQRPPPWKGSSPPSTNHNVRTESRRQAAVPFPYARYDYQETSPGAGEIPYCYERGIHPPNPGYYPMPYGRPHLPVGGNWRPQELAPYHHPGYYSPHAYQQERYASEHFRPPSDYWSGYYDGPQHGGYYPYPPPPSSTDYPHTRPAQYPPHYHGCQDRPHLAIPISSGHETYARSSPEHRRDDRPVQEIARLNSEHVSQKHQMYPKKLPEFSQIDRYRPQSYRNETKEQKPIVRHEEGEPATIDRIESSGSNGLEVLSHISSVRHAKRRRKDNSSPEYENGSDGSSSTSK